MLSNARITLKTYMLGRVGNISITKAVEYINYVTSTSNINNTY